MKTLIENTFGIAIHLAWLAGLGTAGLGVAIWLSAFNVGSSEEEARESPPMSEIDHTVLTTSTIGAVAPTFNDAIVLATIQNLADYTATFSKTESIAGRIVQEQMNLKVRQKPFSVYIQSHSKRRPARESIFVTGKNDDKLVFHESGIRGLITLNMKPDDPRIMSENRYPVTEIGMANLLDAVLAIWEREQHLAASKVEVIISVVDKIGSTECDVIQITHPQRLDGLKFHRTRLSFEKATGFPIQVEQYDWPMNPGDSPPLLEKYTYSDIHANAGLTDVDFDPANSDYSF
ncbi:MAG: DUF1571 domain-containing protein [Planctomycetota bacterium]|nr:DUF1571 domain-containing protein [Planctomycetota bacterium]